MGYQDESHCFNSKLLKTTSGYTLFELLVAIGIGSVIAFGIGALLIFALDSQQKKYLEGTLQEKANEIRNVLANRQTILNTISDPLGLNPRMACLKSQLSCSDMAECASAAQCDPSYIKTGYDITNDRIAIYRSEKTGTPSVFLDGRASNTNGFTERGTACTGFSYDMNNGNDSCPIGYVISWYTLSSGSIRGNTIVIDVKLVYNPSNKNSLKRLINATPTSVASKYDVSSNTTLESFVDLTVHKCYQSGLYLSEGSSGLFYPIASVPLGGTCPQPQSRLCRKQGVSILPILTGTAPFAACVENCTGTWSPCPLPCGGVSTYTATVAGNSFGKNDCPANGTTMSCPACTPVSCVGSWSPCSTGCGGPAGTRTFRITTPARFGGTPCSSPEGATMSCTPPACSPNRDCAGTWSNCSTSCGPGTRTFTVTQAATGLGTACPTSPASCEVQVCPVDCAGTWSPWSACNVACGGGFQTRTFSITTLPEGGGAACSNINGEVESQACNLLPCDPATTLPSGYQHCGGTYTTSGPNAASQTCGNLSCVAWGVQRRFDPSTGIATDMTTSSCFETRIVKTQYTWSNVTGSWSLVGTISDSGSVPRTCQPNC